jgi:putative DNA methylase
MPKPNPDDRRLIEDYLPIEAISAEARREKSVRKGHISTLHLWWARRPLVASRAAVFGALVPAGSVKPEFVADLCTYPGPKDTIQQAQRLILEVHAERLSVERGHTVTVADIEAGRAPRPKVLDMFAGGGAIPLEALRLGCEAYALDLNPVAHLIQLCTLVYPQKYGQPDPAAKGSANASTGSAGSWAGLAAEVEHWGQWMLARVKKEIGDLYPLIPDPRNPQFAIRNSQLSMTGGLTPGGQDNQNMLTPVAYLWTRTVRCKNPSCGGVVPLARQTWLAKKSGRYIALKLDAETNRNQTGDEKKVRYRVVEAATEKGLGFDPAEGSKGGNVACPFCGTVADSAYVKSEGTAHRIGHQATAIVCADSGKRGKVYFGANDLGTLSLPDEAALKARLERLCTESGITVPDELIEANPRSFDTQHFGFETWADLFTTRQLIALLTYVKYIRLVYKELLRQGYSSESTQAIVTYFGLTLDKLADTNNSLCRWEPVAQCPRGLFGRQALPMVWDYGETVSVFARSGSWIEHAERALDSIHLTTGIELAANVTRGSALNMPYNADFFDAIVTDPPYYDNVSYSNLSDFFYVWLKRSVGYLYPEHFSVALTPKKSEAIAASYRHGGNKKASEKAYENMMFQSFSEASRVLKPHAPLIIVYAHKTTVGWATLVDALRRSNFVVVEAWPLDTENASRLIAMDSAALASSIFLVARRREGNEIGAYESNVRPELEAIVRERVGTLWAKGVTGADLVIACVGAGLRAFTRYGRVEYANGEEVPAEKFLGEVEGVVLDTLLEKLFGVARAGIAAVDAATRFYVLWRYAYSTAAIDAGEAIIFAYPQGVELDGPHSLSAGPRALVEKQQSKYRLRDYTERGAADDLGQASDSGPAPLIDVLHRLLHLMDTGPAEIGAFLDEAQPNLDQLLLVAQTLAGSALAGNGSGGGRSLIAARGAEASALRKLTTNWKTIIGTRSGAMM